MSTDEIQSRLEEKLKNNEVVTDLSDFEVDESLLVLVYKFLKTYTNIGSIKWKTNLLNDSGDDSKLSSMFREVENTLISNNNNAEKFPKPLTYGLLNMHTWLDLRASPNYKDSDAFDAEATNALDQRLIDAEWTVKKVTIDSEFKSVLYANKKRRQLVLAFKGVSLGIEDFFPQNPNPTENNQV